MALMDATLGRPMFAGGPPTAPPIQAGGMVGTPPTSMPLPAPSTAVGTGITTGLVPPNEIGAVQPGPDDMALLEGVATNMVNTDMAIDSAEDYESLMNAVRGDVKSEQERRSELAEYVGPEDANKTPESVLAGFVQPQLVMMQAQNSVPNGGLGTAPLDIGGAPPVLGGAPPVLGGAPPLPGGLPSVSGGPPVNFPDASFVQAPGTEEASARIAMGELPIVRKDGTPEEGEGKQDNSLTFFKGPTYDSWLDAGHPYKVPRPNYARLDDESIRRSVENFAAISKPYTDPMKPADMSQFLTARRDLLSDYLTPQVSTAQTRAELEALYGPGLEKEAGIKANLAFAQAGRDIALTPGTLLQGAIVAAGPLAGSIGEIAEQKAEFERGIIGTARAEEKAAEAGLRGEEFAIATSAMEAHASQTSDYLQAQYAAIQDAIRSGLSAEQTRITDFNEATKLAFTTSSTLTAANTEVWGKLDKGIWDIIGVRRGADGVYWFVPSETGEPKKVPKGYHPLDATVLNALTTGQLDWSKAKMTNLVIPDPTHFTGYREVPGWGLEGQYYMNETGDKAVLVSKQYRGFMRGTIADFLEVHPPDIVGRVKIVYKKGPKIGTAVLAGLENTELQRGAMAKIRIDADALLEQGVIDEAGWRQMMEPTEVRTIMVPIPDANGNIPPDWRENASHHRMVEITAPIDTDLAFQLVPPTYDPNAKDENGDPIPVLLQKKMNPMVEVGEKMGVTYAGSSAEQIAYIQQRIPMMIRALRHGQRILDLIPEAVGPLDSVKAFISNNIAIFAPDASRDLFTWSKTARGRMEMDLFSRELIAAIALSERYPVREQEVIKELAQDPHGFFLNEEVAAVNFQALLLFMQNDLAQHRALLEDRRVPQLLPIPTGKIHDPFVFSAFGQYAYLRKARGEGADFSGRFIQMTVQEARDRKLTGVDKKGRPLKMAALSPSDHILIELGGVVQ